MVLKTQTPKKNKMEENTKTITSKKFPNEHYTLYHILIILFRKAQTLLLIIISTQIVSEINHKKKRKTQ